MKLKLFIVACLTVFASFAQAQSFRGSKFNLQEIERLKALDLRGTYEGKTAQDELCYVNVNYDLENINPGSFKNTKAWSISSYLDSAINRDRGTIGGVVPELLILESDRVSVVDFQVLRQLDGTENIQLETYTQPLLPSYIGERGVGVLGGVDKNSADLKLQSGQLTSVTIQNIKSFLKAGDEGRIIEENATWLMQCNDLQRL